MRTAAQEVAEEEILDARLLALHAEKARIDAEIAATTEDLRRHFDDRLHDYNTAGHPSAGLSASSSAEVFAGLSAGVSGGASGRASGRPVKRRSNYADTTTATSIACLLRISERAAHRLVQYSNVLINYQPATHQALHDGLISWQHATTITDECAGLPDSTATLLETELLTIAADTTPARTAYRARKLRAQLHPESLHQRAVASTSRRRVDLDPDHDGMAWLHVHLPATEATAIDARLTHAARALHAPSETRTLAQLRTDVLVDLLLADTPTTTGAGTTGASDNAGAESSGCVGNCGGRGGVRAHVNVTVPVLTLLGVDDAPADLEGYGPIPADVARRLAAHAPSFTRILTHPETGVVMSVGRTTYAVPADLKKWLRVRDQTCRHPGCTIPSSRCEIDHTTPWSHDGPTNHDNLAHLCRKHHTLKSEGIWRYEQHTAGTLTATSPTGRTYTSEPDPAPF